MNVYPFNIIPQIPFFPDTGNESISFFVVSFTERNYTNAFVANLGGILTFYTLLLASCISFVNY